MRKKEIKEWVESICHYYKETDAPGLSEYRLDEFFSIFIGWSAGYGTETRDDVVQSKSEPDFALNVGIKVWTSDSLLTDYDWVNFAYFDKSGEVLDTGQAVTPDEDYTALTNTLLKWYEELKKYTNNMNEQGGIYEL